MNVHLEIKTESTVKIWLIVDMFLNILEITIFKYCFNCINLIERCYALQFPVYCGMLTVCVCATIENHHVQAWNHKHTDSLLTTSLFHIHHSIMRDQETF